MTFEQIIKANETIKTTDIKGKEYAEVNQRIKAFRMCCPNGGIITEMLSCENGVCVFKATVLDENTNVLGTGTAYEKENSSFINKTSFIENCETSAVGRALGMCGFGIDTSVASYEEVSNAVLNQNNAESGAKDRIDYESYAESIKKLICSDCGKEIDKKVYDYSKRVNGKPLCYSCQKKPQTNEPPRSIEQIIEEQDIPF